MSETESVVLEYINPLEDMRMLIVFSTDVFINIKRNLQRALPLFDLTSLDFVDPDKMAYYLSEGLIEKGLYK